MRDTGKLENRSGREDAIRFAQCLCVSVVKKQFPPSGGIGPDLMNRD